MDSQALRGVIAGLAKATMGACLGRRQMTGQVATAPVPASSASRGLTAMSLGSPAKAWSKCWALAQEGCQRGQNPLQENEQQLGKQSSHVANEGHAQPANSGAHRCNMMAEAVKDQDDGGSLVC